MTRLHTGVIVAVLTAVTLPAGAADRKSFHGAFCQLNSGRGEWTEHGASAFYEDATFTCPLVRDRMSSSTSLGTVYVSGRNSGGHFDCYLYSQGEDGSSGTTVDYDHSITSTVGNVELPLSVDVSNGEEGAFAVQCAINFGGTSTSSIWNILTSESTTAVE